MLATKCANGIRFHFGKLRKLNEFTKVFFSRNFEKLFKFFCRFSVKNLQLPCIVLPEGGGRMPRKTASSTLREPGFSQLRNAAFRSKTYSNVPIEKYKGDCRV